MASINWANIYGTGTNQNQGIPMSSNYDTNRGNFRDFSINYNDLLNKSGVANCPVLSIYCDTLQIDNDITVQAGLFIFARRVVAPNGTTILLSRLSGNYVPFTILSQEVVDANDNPSTINVSAANDASAVTTATFAASGQECGLSWPMENANASPFLVSNLDLTQFSYGQPLQLSLMSIFSLASVVFTTSNDAAIKQLQWICNLGRFGNDTMLLAAQAKSFCSTLVAKQSLSDGAILVPSLDLSVYNNKAKATLDFLQSQQTAYNNVLAQINNEKQWSANAQAMVQVSNIESTLYTSLQNQAQQTYDQAQYARMLAGQEIVIENNELFGLKIKFDRGVETWKAEKQKEEALKIVTGVVQILEQIPAIVAAGPEMAVLPALQTAGALAASATNISSAIASKISANPTSAKRKPIYGGTEPGDIEMTEINPGATSSSTATTPTSTPAAKPSATDADKEKAEKTQESLIAAAKNIGEGASTIVDSAMKIYAISRTAEEL